MVQDLERDSLEREVGVQDGYSQSCTRVYLKNTCARVYLKNSVRISFSTNSSE